MLYSRLAALGIQNFQATQSKGNFVSTSNLALLPLPHCIIPHPDLLSSLPAPGVLPLSWRS